jgi:hypothetical protein
MVASLGWQVVVDVWNSGDESGVVKAGCLLACPGLDPGHDEDNR